MTIPYRIVKIENSQFAVFPEKFDNGKPVKVETSFQFATSADTSVVKCVTFIHYLQNENVLLLLENATYFSIAPEGIAAIRKEGRIPVDFLRYMATIAVGTVRGIIHAKTEGLVFNAIVLPPINLVEIIKNDLVVEAESKK